MTAALEAAECGKDVVLVEENPSVDRERLRLRRRTDFCFIDNVIAGVVALPAGCFIGFDLPAILVECLDRKFSDDSGGCGEPDDARPCNSNDPGAQRGLRSVR